LTPTLLQSSTLIIIFFIITISSSPKLTNTNIQTQNKQHSSKMVSSVGGGKSSGGSSKARAGADTTQVRSATNISQPFRVAASSALKQIVTIIVGVERTTLMYNALISKKQFCVAPGARTQMSLEIIVALKWALLTVKPASIQL
jgi:hypothetical protein